MLSEAKAETDAASTKGQELAEVIARQELDDRTLITRTVTTVFFVAVPLSILVLLVLSFFSKEAAPEAIKATADILKSVLLPIMTLVLGYYFGRRA